MIEHIDLTTGEILEPHVIRRRIATRRASWKRQDEKAGYRKPSRRKVRHGAYEHIIVAVAGAVVIVGYYLLV